MKKKKTNGNNIEKNDYYVFSYKLSDERLEKAYKRITRFLPSFKLGTRASLKDIDFFLAEKYKAVQADWKEIDACTRTKIKRYNKYCQTVFCVSESYVTDDDYHTAYIIKREHLINPSFEKDDFFYDLFLIVGSEDKEHITSYFIGGSSEGFAEEIYVMCGKKLTELSIFLS